MPLSDNFNPGKDVCFNFRFLPSSFQILKQNIAIPGYKKKLARAS